MSCLEASKRKKKIKVELKSKISKFTQEMSNCSILDLPELILHQICTLLSCPFDLINLGSTCQKLYEVTNVPSLWIRLAFNWCEGIWQWIDDVPSAENERTWFINLLHNAAKLPHDAKHHCSLENGEEWIRVDSKRFRSYVGMLQWSYGDRDEYHHPAILFRRWIYDVGLFRRKNPQINVTSNDDLSNSSRKALAALGGGAARDLRARKFPNIDPVYYVRFLKIAHFENLFPLGFNGCLCPLIIDNTSCEYNRETAGPEGLVLCISIAAANLLVSRCYNREITLSYMTYMIKRICQTFYNVITKKLPEIQNQLRCSELKSIILYIADNDDNILDIWQEDLDKLKVVLKCKDLIRDCATILRKYDWLDAIVDQIKSRWRQCLQEEIFSVLNISHQEKLIQINLTDSDLIGGDNRRQEMASAAFVSKDGVLVTWQLTGRGRY
ncbi:uncharacterized protein [Centruroides vittatus]|uniref:uncharacterized protein isoform X1 n=1 Tax=Centruroides vittatus TaxID=120091 RepID=UPI00350F8A26